MKLYSVEWDYREKRYVSLPNPVEYVVDRAFSGGSESEQLVKIRGLISILTEKLLDAGLLELEEIKYLFEDNPDGPFYKTKEEADKCINLLQS